MGFAVIPLVAFLASGLTLFSGFGLGSILMPVMALFFPVEAAIAATAIVHLANNIFKLFLFGKYRRNDVLISFAVPAVASAAVGAWTLTVLSEVDPILRYTSFGKTVEVETLKVVIAVLITLFALFEILPRLRDLKFSSGLLPLGGVISGLLGGLSGHQGALRSAFLINLGLTKEQFIGTGVTIACLVDVTRLTVYGVHFSSIGLENGPLILTSCIAAFSGAFIGRRLVEKVTMRHVQTLVGICLILLSLALGSGVI